MTIPETNTPAPASLRLVGKITAVCNCPCTPVRDILRLVCNNKNYFISWGPVASSFSKRFRILFLYFERVIKELSGALRTITGIEYFLKFCWYLRFLSKVIRASKFSDSINLSNSPFLTPFHPQSRTVCTLWGGKISFNRLGRFSSSNSFNERFNFTWWKEFFGNF